jgi:radical SAM superfamily enzyme YgiQ (UPF0313 family)
VRYEGRLYRPPSEAESFILQATVGCSWNKCTYCDMYGDKEYRARPLAEILEDIAEARRFYGPGVFKVFVADGDPLHMPMDLWRPLLEALRKSFPKLRRVSTYAMATNVLDKSDAELSELRELGLSLLYIGPESGSDAVLKRIAKGSDFEAHAEAARRAHAASMKLSTIFLLGAGGIERSDEHARESARLATAMDPAFLSALTLTVVPDTPIAKLQARGRFTLPDTLGLLRELRTIIDLAHPTAAIFRSNHASNYLPLSGVLPRDREQLLRLLDAALDGSLPLRDEWMRGL